jgi:hypothetical protein
MGKIIFIFSFLIQVNAWSVEMCAPDQSSASPRPGADNFGSKISIIVGQSSDDINTKFDAANTFLAANQNGGEFKEADAKLFIASLTPICENTKLDNVFRSKTCSSLAGLHGILAQKLQLAGVSNGQSAFKYLHQSLQLDPSNIAAIFGHASTIVGINDQGWLAKKAAAIALHTNIIDEAKIAKANLERVHQTNSPIYKQILDII